ncbi:MAG: enoyl-CoA hydratase/isomerase family protein [Acidimicrobiia bacterium]|nr:enoyl-CoA hydratase/isomerase family protein [Acidimicrobiia bacterium]
MGVVELDARLLRAGAAALDAALADHLGTPTLVAVDGAPDSLAPDTIAYLRRLPALTLATGPDAEASPCDLAAATPEIAGRWRDSFLRAPQAAVSAALLLRDPAPDVWTGLTAESAAYSMLLASREFATWRAATPARPIEDRDASRVRVEHEGAVTVITLTRPAHHNAVDARLRDELCAALAEAALHPGPVVLRGDGPSFCSGGDLDTFGSLADPAAAHLLRLGRSLPWRTHTLAPRLVVGLHGACLGAGIELAAFAARVIAADDATIGLPELALGLIPGSGGTVSMPRRAGARRVLGLLLTDGTIPAATAREWGLVDEVVPRAHLDARLLEVAESLP